MTENHVFECYSENSLKIISIMFYNSIKENSKYSKFLG